MPEIRKDLEERRRHQRVNLHADVYNMMPRTENDTVNQYFIHTSFKNPWSTPKKSENDVITELEQDIEQLQQKIEEQLSKISNLKDDIRGKQKIWERLLENLKRYV